MHDDLAYHYYYDENSAIERPTSEPISSFWQIFPSMWNHYNAVNGRYTSHFIIQLFCGLLGKSIFNYFNTIIFLLFIDLMVIMSYGKRRLLPLALVVASIVFLLPFPGQTMLWLTGSVNYLWAATFSLLVLKIITSRERKKTVCCLLLFFFAVFSGWMNESISFGIGGGLVFYFLFNRSRFTGISRWMTIGYLIGCLLILFSPGTMNRVSAGEINTEMTVIQMFMSRMINSVILLKNIPILSLSWIVLFLACFKRFRFMIKGAPIFVLSFILTAIFCFILGLTEKRIYFGLSVLGTIIIVNAIYHCIQDFYIPAYLRYVFASLLLLVCVPEETKAYHKTKDYLIYIIDIEEHIKASSDECVIELPNEIMSSRFVFATKVDANRYQFHNRIRAFYYRKKYVQGLPHELMNLVIDDSLSFYRFPFWFVPYSNGKYVESVYYEILPDNDYLSLRQRIIRYFLGTLNLSHYQQHFFDFDNYGTEYLALPMKDSVGQIELCLKDGSKEVLFPPTGSSHIIHYTK